MSTSNRLTLKQADAQDRQQRLSSHRRELTNRIRKQKKHQYMARKRQYGATPPPDMAHSLEVARIQPLIKDLCSIPMLDSLQKLHDALQLTPLEASEDNWLVVLPADDSSTASSLIGHMRGLASTPEGLPLVLNILVRLTSISYVPQGDSMLNFYGKMPLSWASLVSHNSTWLSHLVQLAPQTEAACVVLGNLVGEANGQSFVLLRQAGLIQALLSAVHRPAAAWALTNAIRHDAAEYAHIYCNDQALSAALLEQLLKEPPVATQAAWMLTALTNREENVVQYIMSYPTFAETMIACMRRPVCQDQLAPLVQALGNIATSSSYEGGPPFSTSLIANFPTLTPMLGQLLQIPTNREVVQQAASLASCLLLDAGTPEHPATTIAAPRLVPLLFQELRENTPHSFQNQCELVHALWNALSLPGVGSYWFAPEKTVLIPLPQWDIIRPALSNLVKLAGSVDVDVCMATVSVIKLLIERNNDQERIRMALLEADVTTVLEKVCDFGDKEASEIAAGLLDDVFYVEEADMEENTGDIMPDGTFAFGLGGVGGSREYGFAPSEGMGRGRGTMVPAWMEQGNNHMKNSR